MSHPRGLSGTPADGHCPAAREKCLLYGVLGGVEMAVPPDQRAEDLRRVQAQQVLGLGGSSHGPQMSPAPSRMGRITTG